MANANVLDYNTREGQALFRTATESLYKDRDDSFDCDAEGLNDLLQLIEDCSNLMGWANIYQIPDNNDPLQPVIRDFLQNYGVVSIDMIHAHVRTYIVQPTRPAQDSYMLYHCLMNSLSLIGRSKITIWRLSLIHI